MTNISTIEEIEIASIEIGERIRPLDMDLVTNVYAPSIKEDGLHQPILVRRTGDKTLLVCGLHRLESFRLLGRQTIPAYVRRMGTERAALAEIDENILRKQFSALETAEALSLRQALFLKLNPDARQGGDRRSEKFQTEQNSVWSFAKDAAESVGMSDRQIRKYLQASKLPKPARDALRPTPHSNNLQTLLKLVDVHIVNPRRLDDVIALMVRADDPLSVDSAIDCFVPTSKERAPWTGFVSFYTRADTEDRRAGLRAVVASKQFINDLKTVGIPGYRLVPEDDDA